MTETSHDTDRILPPSRPMRLAAATDGENSQLHELCARARAIPDQSVLLTKAENLRQRLDTAQINVPAQRGPENRQARRPSSHWGPGRPEGPLTTKEQAVLRLLATSLPFREISQCLHISPNTLKSHARAIYRKLGAADRREAVQRGQELAILRTKRPLLKSGSYR